MISIRGSWRLAMFLGGLALVSLAVLVPGESAQGSPDVTVRMGSDTVAPGGSITLDLDALNVAVDPPDGPLGAFTIEVEYDPALLDATACTSDPGGIFDAANCSAIFDNDDVFPDKARCTGASTSGVSGAVLTLCEITFQADASATPGTVTPLPVNCLVLTTPGGVAIPCVPQPGEITIEGNIPPECDDTSASTPQDTPVIFDLPCSDSDSGPGPLTCSVVPAGPPNGDVDLTNCSATYTPDAGFTGQDCFDYKANDGADDSNTATACIDVTGDECVVVVRVGDGAAPPGDSDTVTVEMDVPPDCPVGAVTVGVDYDPALLEATDCTADPGGILDAANCSPTFDNDDVPPDWARCTGASTAGVSGTGLSLCEITFQVIGPSPVPLPVVTPLSVDCVVLTTAGGDPIPCTPEFGQFEIVPPCDVDCATVRIGSGSVPPGGGLVTLPVEVLGVTDPPRLGAATIDAVYNPGIPELPLSATACEADPAGVFDLALCNLLPPDRIRCAVNDAAGESGDLLICDITFEAGACVPGTVVPIDPVVETLLDPPGSDIQHTTVPGEIACIRMMGDVDCDGDVDGGDSLFVLQYVVFMRQGSDECPSLDPPEWTLYLPACDVDESGDCDLVDALFILQCVVELPPGFDMPFCLAAQEAQEQPSPQVSTNRR